MQKIYGTTTILIASIFALIFSGVLVQGIYGIIIGNFEIKLSNLGFLIQSLIFLFPIYLLFIRGKKIFTGHIIISEPRSSIKSLLFYSGGVLIIISLLILAYTVTLMIYLTVRNTSGVPAGIGIGFALMPFILGACLIECTANNSKIDNIEPDLSFNAMVDQSHNKEQIK